MGATLETYETNNVQITKIASNLGKLCLDLDINDSMPPSYREQIITHQNDQIQLEESKTRKPTYLDRL